MDVKESINRWNINSDEKPRFPMPSYLGRLAGLSFREEVLIINLLGLICSSLGWSFPKWTSQVETILNLPLTKETYIFGMVPELTIKTILSRTEITRIILADASIFAYITNIYPILTCCRPSLLLPWMAICIFKDFLLQAVIILIGSVIWYEENWSIFILLEFLIVQVASLMFAKYTWSYNIRFFVLIKRLEEIRKIRRSVMRSESNLQHLRIADEIGDTFASPKYRTRSLTTLLSSNSQETNDSEDIASTIFEDPELTPFEKSMKILGITLQDVMNARSRLEKISFQEAAMLEPRQNLLGDKMASLEQLAAEYEQEIGLTENIGGEVICDDFIGKKNNVFVSPKKTEAASQKYPETPNEKFSIEIREKLHEISQRSSKEFPKKLSSIISKKSIKLTSTLDADKGSKLAESILGKYSDNVDTDKTPTECLNETFVIEDTKTLRGDEDFLSIIRREPKYGEMRKRKGNGTSSSESRKIKARPCLSLIKKREGKFCPMMRQIRDKIPSTSPNHGASMNVPIIGRNKVVNKCTFKENKQLPVPTKVLVSKGCKVDGSLRDDVKKEKDSKCETEMDVNYFLKKNGCTEGSLLDDKNGGVSLARDLDLNKSVGKEDRVADWTTKNVTSKVNEVNAEKNAEDNFRSKDLTSKRCAINNEKDIKNPGPEKSLNIPGSGNPKMHFKNENPFDGGFFDDKINFSRLPVNCVQNGRPEKEEQIYVSKLTNFTLRGTKIRDKKNVANNPDFWQFQNIPNTNAETKEDCQIMSNVKSDEPMFPGNYAFNKHRNNSGEDKFQSLKDLWMQRSSKEIEKKDKTVDDAISLDNDESAKRDGFNIIQEIINPESWRNVAIKERTKNLDEKIISLGSSDDKKCLKPEDYFNKKEANFPNKQAVSTFDDIFDEFSTKRGIINPENSKETSNENAEENAKMKVVDKSAFDRTEFYSGNVCARNKMAAAAAAFEGSSLLKPIKDCLRMFDGVYEKDLAEDPELRCLFQQLEKGNWNLLPGIVNPETFNTLVFPVGNDKAGFHDEDAKVLDAQRTVMAVDIETLERDEASNNRKPTSLISRSIQTNFKSGKNLDSTAAKIDPGTLERTACTQTSNSSCSSVNKNTIKNKRKRALASENEISVDADATLSVSVAKVPEDKKPKLSNSPSRKPSTDQLKSSKTRSSNHLRGGHDRLKLPTVDTCECRLSKNKTVDSAPKKVASTARKEYSLIKKMTKPGVATFGTISLAQTAHASGFERMKVHGKPPVYPARNRTSSRNKINEEKRQAREEHVKEVGARRSNYSSRSFGSKKGTGSSEEKEAMEMRALRAYNQATLLEYNRNYEATKKNTSSGTRHSKIHSSMSQRHKEPRKMADCRDVLISYDDYLAKENLFLKRSDAPRGNAQKGADFGKLDNVDDAYLDKKSVMRKMIFLTEKIIDLGDNREDKEDRSSGIIMYRDFPREVEITIDDNADKSIVGKELFGSPSTESFTSETFSENEDCHPRITIRRRVARNKETSRDDKKEVQDKDFAAELNKSAEGEQKGTVLKKTKSRRKEEKSVNGDELAGLHDNADNAIKIQGFIQNGAGSSSMTSKGIINPEDSEEVLKVEELRIIEDSKEIQDESIKKQAICATDTRKDGKPEKVVKAENTSTTEFLKTDQHKSSFMMKFGRNQAAGAIFSANSVDVENGGAILRGGGGNKEGAEAVKKIDCNIYPENIATNNNLQSSNLRNINNIIQEKYINLVENMPGSSSTSTKNINKQESDKVPKTDPGVPETDRGVPKMDPGVSDTGSGVSKPDPGFPKLEPGVPKTDPGLPKLEPGVPKTDPKIPADTTERERNPSVVTRFIRNEVSGSTCSSNLSSSEENSRILETRSENNNNNGSLSQDRDITSLPLDLREITRNIDWRLRPQGVVLTNKNLRPSNLNDVNQATQQRDIIDDNTANIVHNAFHHKPEITLRTFLRGGSSNDNQDEDADAIFRQIVNDSRRDSSTSDFVCQPENDISAANVGTPILPELRVTSHFDAEFSTTGNNEDSNQDGNNYNLCIIAINHEEPSTDSDFTVIEDFGNNEENLNFEGTVLENVLVNIFELIRRGDFSNLGNEVANNASVEVQEFLDVEQNGGCALDSEKVIDEEEGRKKSPSLFDEEGFLTNLKLPIVIKNVELDATDVLTSSNDAEESPTNSGAERKTVLPADKDIDNLQNVNNIFVPESPRKNDELRRKLKNVDRSETQRKKKPEDVKNVDEEREEKEVAKLIFNDSIIMEEVDEDKKPGREEQIHSRLFQNREKFQRFEKEESRPSKNIANFEIGKVSEAFENIHLSPDSKLPSTKAGIFENPLNEPEIFDAARAGGRLLDSLEPIETSWNSSSRSELNERFLSENSAKKMAAKVAKFEDKILVFKEEEQVATEVEREAEVNDLTGLNNEDTDLENFTMASLEETEDGGEAANEVEGQIFLRIVFQFIVFLFSLLYVYDRLRSFSTSSKATVTSTDLEVHSVSTSTSTSKLKEDECSSKEITSAEGNLSKEDNKAEVKDVVQDNVSKKDDKVEVRNLVKDNLPKNDNEVEMKDVVKDNISQEEDKVEVKDVVEDNISKEEDKVAVKDVVEDNISQEEDKVEVKNVIKDNLSKKDNKVEVKDVFEHNISQEEDKVEVKNVVEDNYSQEEDKVEVKDVVKHNLTKEEDKVEVKDMVEDNLSKKDNKVEVKNVVKHNLPKEEDKVEVKNVVKHNLPKEEDKVEVKDVVKDNISQEEDKVELKDVVEDNISQEEDKVEVKDVVKHNLTKEEDKVEVKDVVKDNLSQEEDKVEVKNVVKHNLPKEEDKVEVKDNLSKKDNKVEGLKGADSRKDSLDDLRAIQEDIRFQSFIIIPEGSPSSINNSGISKSVSGYSSSISNSKSDEKLSRSKKYNNLRKESRICISAENQDSRGNQGEYINLIKTMDYQNNSREKSSSSIGSEIVKSGSEEVAEQKITGSCKSMINPSTVLSVLGNSRMRGSGEIQKRTSDNSLPLFGNPESNIEDNKNPDEVRQRFSQAAILDLKDALNPINIDSNPENDPKTISEPLTNESLEIDKKIDIQKADEISTTSKSRDSDTSTIHVNPKSGKSEEDSNSIRNSSAKNIASENDDSIKKEEEEVTENEEDAAAKEVEKGQSSDENRPLSTASSDDSFFSTFSGNDEKTEELTLFSGSSLMEEYSDAFEGRSENPQ